MKFERKGKGAGTHEMRHTAGVASHRFVGRLQTPRYKTKLFPRHHHDHGCDGDNDAGQVDAIAGFVASAEEIGAFECEIKMAASTMAAR